MVILNVYAPNKRISKYMDQKLVNWKEKRKIHNFGWKFLKRKISRLASLYCTDGMRDSTNLETTLHIMYSTFVVLEGYYSHREHAYLMIATFYFSTILVEEWRRMHEKWINEPNFELSGKEREWKQNLRHDAHITGTYLRRLHGNGSQCLLMAVYMTEK